MNFRNRICQTLHDEHLANIALLQRIGQLLAAQGRTPPDNNQAVQRLLSDLGSGMAMRSSATSILKKVGCSPISTRLAKAPSAYI